MGFISAAFDFAPLQTKAGGDGGDAGGPAPLLEGFYVHSKNGRFKRGANLVSITGAQFVYADYGDAKIRNDLLRGDYL